MFFLIDAVTQDVVQVVHGSFQDFIHNKYGGWYQYKDPHTGMLRSNHILGWAQDSSKYWSQQAPASYYRRYMCHRTECGIRLSCPQDDYAD